MTTSHIGATIYYAAGVPATNTASAFAAMTWVNVAGAQTLPQLGVSHDSISVEDIRSGFTKALKGAATGVDSTSTFREVEGDAGQLAIAGLANARGDAGTGSVRIVYGTGADNAPVTGDECEYAQGYFHSLQPNQGSVSSYKGFSVNFMQNDFTVKGTIPA